MNHYDEQYDKLHEEEIRIEHEAQIARRKLLELPYNMMIKIMFNGYLNILNNKQIIELSKSIRGGNVNL